MSDQVQNLVEILAQQALMHQQKEQQMHYHLLNYMQSYAQHQGRQWQQIPMQQLQPRFIFQTCQSNQIFAPELLQSIQSQHPQEDLSFQIYLSNQQHKSKDLVLNQLSKNNKQVILSSSDFINIKVKTEASNEQKTFYSYQDIFCSVKNKLVPQQNLQQQATKVEDQEIVTEKDVPTSWISKNSLQGQCDIIINSKQKISLDQSNSYDQGDSSLSANLNLNQISKNEDNLGIQQSKTSRKIQKNVKKISKNIPKNIFKGIIKYIIGKKEDISRYFQKDQDEVNQYIQHIKSSRNSVLSMQQIKDFLHSKQNEKYSKLSRIFSHQFVNQHYIAYIYNSKIKCRREHVAKKQKFLNVISNKLNNI